MLSYERKEDKTMSYQEAKQRILDRIASIDEWPAQNQGLDRMTLIQEAYEAGWWPS